MSDTLDLNRVANDFNSQYPIGSTVKLMLPSGSEMETMIKYPAEVMFGKDVAVMVYGLPGFHPISQVLS